jgi:hypothetical protein
MSKTEQATVATLRQQKVLDQLQTGVLTWGELRTSTKINDENLGFTLGELLNLRKIWTIQQGDVRVYGIERRRGLVPRFAHKWKRATDPPT